MDISRNARFVGLLSVHVAAVAFEVCASCSVLLVSSSTRFSACALDGNKASKLCEARRASIRELLPIVSSLRENLHHCLMDGKDEQVGTTWSCGMGDGGVGGGAEDCKNFGLCNISLVKERVFYFFARSVFFRASWLNRIKFMAKSITSYILCIHAF